LSQRELAERTGIPQGHISRIERGEVDLQVSSLVELVRALEMDLVLVPREKLYQTRALLGGVGLRVGEERAAYRLDEEEDV